MIAFNPLLNQFSVSTNDASKIGDYKILITASLPRSFLTSTLLIDLSVICVPSKISFIQTHSP